MTRKQCVICKKKFEITNMRIGYGNYWCIKDWNDCDKYLANCFKCDSSFVADGFHNICKKCLKIRHHKKGGFEILNKKKFCPLCKQTVPTCVISWLYDWERCSICTVNLPLPKYVIEFLKDPLRKIKRKKPIKYFVYPAPQEKQTHFETGLVAI